MKKKLSGLLCVLLAMVCMFTFTACNSKITVDSAKYDDVSGYIDGTAIVNDAGRMYFVNDGKKSKTSYDSLKYLGGDFYYQALEKPASGYEIVDKNDNKIFSPGSGERFISYEALYNYTLTQSGKPEYRFLNAFIGTLNGGNKVFINTAGKRSVPYAEVTKLYGKYYSAKRVSSHTAGIGVETEVTYDLFNADDAAIVISGAEPVGNEMPFWGVSLTDYNNPHAAAADYIVAVTAEYTDANQNIIPASYDVFDSNMNKQGTYASVEFSDYVLVGAKVSEGKAAYDIYTARSNAQNVASAIPIKADNFDYIGYTYVVPVTIPDNGFVLRSVLNADAVISKVYKSIGGVEQGCYRVAVGSDDTEYYLSVYTGKELFSNAVSENKWVVKANAVNGSVSMLVSERPQGVTLFTYYSDKLSKPAEFRVSSELSIGTPEVTAVANVFRIVKLQAGVYSYAVWAPETDYDSKHLNDGDIRSFTFYDTMSLFTFSPVTNQPETNMVMFSKDGVYSLAALDNTWQGAVNENNNLFPVIGSSEKAAMPVRKDDITVRFDNDGTPYAMNLMQFDFQYTKSDGLTVERQNVLIYNNNIYKDNASGVFGTFESLFVGGGTAVELEINGQFGIANAYNGLTEVYSVNDKNGDIVFEKRLSAYGSGLTAAYALSDVRDSEGLYRKLDEYYYYILASNGKTAVYDAQYELVLPAVYTHVSDAKNRNFVVHDDSGNAGVVKSTSGGKFSISVPLKYAGVKLFEDGSALCLEKNMSLFTLFNQNGKKLAGNIYGIEDLSPDMAKYSKSKIKIAYKLNVGNGYKMLIINAA